MCVGLGAWDTSDYIAAGGPCSSRAKLFLKPSRGRRRNIVGPCIIRHKAVFGVGGDLTYPRLPRSRRILVVSRFRGGWPEVSGV